VGCVLLLVAAGGWLSLLGAGCRSQVLRVAAEGWLSLLGLAVAAGAGSLAARGYLVAAGGWLSLLRAGCRCWGGCVLLLVAAGGWLSQLGASSLAARGCLGAGCRCWGLLLFIYPHKNQWYTSRNFHTYTHKPTLAYTSSSHPQLPTPSCCRRTRSASCYNIPTTPYTNPHQPGFLSLPRIPE
jgi:hypothetical protein